MWFEKDIRRNASTVSSSEISINMSAKPSVWNSQNKSESFSRTDYYSATKSDIPSHSIIYPYPSIYADNHPRKKHK